MERPVASIAFEQPRQGYKVAYL